MWKFWKIEPEHFKVLLEAGKFDDLIEEIYVQFWELPVQHQYELVKYSKKKAIFPSVGVLRKVFGASEEGVRGFFNGKYKEFCFPVVGSGHAEFVNAFLIEGSNEVLTNLKGIKKYLKPVKEFIGKGFWIFFDKEFSGSSFQLPTVLNLYVENMPSDVMFSGAVDKNGNIRTADKLEEKRKLAESRGLRFVEPYQFKNVQEIKEWFDANRYDVPLYITKTADGWEGEWKKYLSSLCVKEAEELVKKLEILSGVETKPLVVGQLVGKAWEEVAKTFWKRFKDTERRLHGKEKWHIAINGPSALAFALGVLFGSQKPFIFYHFQNNTYHPIPVDNVRELKERSKNLEKVSLKFEKGGKNLVVMLSFAHHDMESRVKEYVLQKIKSPSYLLIESERSGNITVEDMKELAKECANLIQNIKKEQSFEDFHFFFSTPVPIAFMVGLAFGHYEDGWIYNYNGSYEPVLSISFLRKLREGKYEEANL